MTTQHTVESLTALASKYAITNGEDGGTEEEFLTARAALSTAITEVFDALAEEQKLAANALNDFLIQRERSDTLQSKCDEQAREIEQLKEKNVTLRKWIDDGSIFERTYSAGIEQEREIERLTGCLKKANDNHEEFERKWYLACDERDTLAAKVAAMEAQLAQANGMAAAWKLTHDAVLAPGAAPNGSEE